MDPVKRGRGRDKAAAAGEAKAGMMILEGATAVGRTAGKTARAAD